MAASTFCNGRTSDRYIYRGGMHVIAVLMFKGALCPAVAKWLEKATTAEGGWGLAYLHSPSLRDEVDPANKRQTLYGTRVWWDGVTSNQKPIINRFDRRRWFEDLV
jgi:hypothetical protein